MNRLTRTVWRMLLVAAAVTAWHAPGWPATRSEVMMSRYLRYLFCMERALGRMWWEPAGVRLSLNRWGVSEPTFATISAATRPVVAADAKCRLDNEIQAEPRP